jgi:hypothetical protein
LVVRRARRFVGRPFQVLSEGTYVQSFAAATKLFAVIALHCNRFKRGLVLQKRQLRSV